MFSIIVVACNVAIVLSAMPFVGAVTNMAKAAIAEPMKVNMSPLSDLY